MAATTSIRLGEDAILSVIGPTDEASGLPITTPTSITARLFDDQADARIPSGVPASSAQIVLDSDRHDFEVGDTVRVWQDDGVDHEATVSVVLGATITISPATTASVSPNVPLRRKLGPDVALSTSPYGTPVAYGDDWGFRGTIAAGHAGLRPWQKVRAEIEFNGGANLIAREVLHLYIVPPWSGQRP